MALIGRILSVHSPDIFAPMELGLMWDVLFLRSFWYVFLFPPQKNVDNHGDCRNEEITTTNRGNEATMKIPNVNTTMGKSRLDSKTPLCSSHLK